jgi:hypothetical protein
VQPDALSVMPRTKKRASAAVDPQREEAAAADLGSDSSLGKTPSESPAQQQPHAHHPAADRVSGWMMSALDEVQGAGKA